MHNVLITGASRGIGNSIKNLFESKEGFNVLSPTRDEMDLTSNESIEKYLISLDTDIDVLINNAGINELVALADITDEKIHDMLQVNLIAQIKLISLIAPKMIINQYGRIVNISSIWSDFSKEKRILYSVAKSGVNGLTISSAVELAKHNILVNAVAPGFVNTEMTMRNNTILQMKQLSLNLPIQRLAEPEEIAEVVYFLASEKNTFITGQTIFVDGGFSCV